MEKNNPTIFQKMRQAVERIKLNEPTADDYRLVMQWPAIAAMFFKSSIQKK